MATPTAKIEAFVASLEPGIRKAFLAAIYDIRSAAQLQLIVGHLEAGNVDAAVVAMNLRPEFLAPLDAELSRAFLEGGRFALSTLPAIAAPFPVSVWKFALMAETPPQSAGSETTAET